MGKFKNTRLALCLSLGLTTAFTAVLPGGVKPAYAAEAVLDITDYGPLQKGTPSPAAEREKTQETEVAKTEVQEATVSETAAAGVNTVLGNPVKNTGYTGASVNLSRLNLDGATKSIGDSIQSKYAAVFDLDQNRMVAAKNADKVIYPASMTKIMTVLVCAERVSNLEEKLTITQDIVNYVNEHDASNCGFSAGEQVSIKDLLYGIVLPSGADAVMALTRHIAGSEEAFVGLMNQKAKDLGLSSSTHFTNATGLYDSNHKTTLGDMAEIMNAALKNPVAREVLSAHKYTTAATNKHSSGLNFSNLFLRRIEDRELGGATVKMAKTGYVRQSMFCAASYGTSASGRNYIVVTAYGPSTWQCIYDQAGLYKTYGV